MGHEQGVFSRRFVFGLPIDPFFIKGSFLLFFSANDEFISKGENDMKRNKRPSREIVVRWRFLGGEKADLCAFTPGGRWKMEKRKTMKAKNRN
jgi:hypothetical protein